MFACMCFQLLQNFMLNLEKKCVNFCTHIFVNGYWTSGCDPVSLLQTPHSLLKALNKSQKRTGPEVQRVFVTHPAEQFVHFGDQTAQVTVGQLKQSLWRSLWGKHVLQRQEDEKWLSWAYDWQVESCHHGNQEWRPWSFWPRGFIWHHWIMNHVMQNILTFVNNSNIDAN